MKEMLRNRWEGLTPGHQRTVMVMGVLGALLSISYGVVAITEKRGPANQTPTTTETHVMTGSRRDMNLESLGGQLAAQQSEIERIKQVLLKNDQQLAILATDVSEKVMEKMRAEGSLSSAEVVALREKVAKLESSVREGAKGGSTTKDGPPPIQGAPSLSAPLTTAPTLGPAPTSTSGSPQLDSQIDQGAGTTKPRGFRVHSNQTRGSTGQQFGGAGETSGQGQPAATNSAPQVAAGNGALQAPTGSPDKSAPALTQGVATQAAPAGAGNASDSVWLPAGSMMTGVLLNGMDAPTSAHAQKNPTPVLIRLKTLSILPNRARLDLRECFVMASGFGVMSTERAQLRTEVLSCVRKDGGVVEATLSGYVVGEDGKVGLRGRLASKQGSLLAKSLASGLFGGLSQALKPQAILGINTGATGGSIGVQQPNASDVLSSGVYQGASTALDSISKFYLDMAKEMFPVVEIDAARKAEVIITKGVSLRLQSAKPAARTLLGQRPNGNPNLRD